MTTRPYVANGPVLSVIETLREMGFSKAKAARFAREAELLVDRVLPRRQPKPGAKRPSTPRPPKAKARRRSQLADAA